VLTFAAAVLGAGCDRVPGIDGGPPVLELAHDTIRLESGVSLHDVTVRRHTDSDFDPAQLQARPGDVVRFTAGDRGGHAIGFVGDALSTAARDFLERTGQLRSPPLIDAGASWVITLEGAPPGEYPFHCMTHDAPGRLTVAPQE
jgi:plastocyanin